MFGKNYLLPFIISAVFAVGLFIGGRINYNNTTDHLFSVNVKKNKLNKLIDYIDYQYVDQVNTDSIVDVTVTNILKKLDPHSVYIPKQKVQQLAENMKGDYVGIGISFYMYKDSLAVIRSIKNGPGKNAGIRSGDRILIANNDTLYGRRLSSEKITQILKGEDSSPLTLTIYRPSEDKILNLNMVRGAVPLSSVDVYYMVSDEIGFLKINRFGERTYEEFKQALLDLKEKGMKQLILDLRDNPGGYLSTAKQISDEFLAKGKLILFTKDRDNTIEESYASIDGNFEKEALYVLINENSASASEIVAGAIQDNDRGMVVGRRSFGKGLVQQEMELGDGSVIRLTVSRYYTPTGRSIQRFYDNKTDAYYNQYYKRFEDGVLYNSDSIKLPDSLIYKTSKGKIVYGGGGITPDVFVALKENKEDTWVKSLLQSSGLISFYVFEFLESHRNEFKHVTTKDFLKEYQVDQRMVNEFIAFINERGLKTTLSSYSSSIKKQLKAVLAEQLFDEQIKHRVLLEGDPILDATIRISNK